MHFKWGIIIQKCISVKWQGPELRFSELFLYSVPETVHELGPPRLWPEWNLRVHVWCTEGLCTHQELHLAHVPQVWVRALLGVFVVSQQHFHAGLFPSVEVVRSPEPLSQNHLLLFVRAAGFSGVILPDWRMSAQWTVLNIKAKLMGIQRENQVPFAVALRSNTL